MDPSIKPLQVGVTVNKAGVVKDIKNAIQTITSIPAKNLALVDVGRSKFFKEWQDFEETCEVGENDTVAAYVSPSSASSSSQLAKTYGSFPKQNQPSWDWTFFLLPPLEFQRFFCLFLQRLTDFFVDMKLFLDLKKIPKEKMEKKKIQTMPNQKNQQLIKIMIMK